jgi:predicted ester cyclase
MTTAAQRGAVEQIGRVERGNGQIENGEARMTLERHKAIVRRVFEDGFGKGDLSAVDEGVSEQFEGHYHTPADFREHLKRVIVVFRTAFPDLTADVELLAAEGDLVAARVVLRGTHRGLFQASLLAHDAPDDGPRPDGSHVGPPPLPPTGRAIELEQHHFVRFDGDAGVAHWMVQDTMALLQQLGVLPPPGGRPA